MQVDGHAGFERLTASGGVVLAAGWAHALAEVVATGTESRVDSCAPQPPGPILERFVRLGPHLLTLKE